MAGRVSLQVQRVLNRLKDKGEHTYTRDEILTEINIVQADLCRDYLALKSDMTVGLIAGTSEYVLSSVIYKVKEFFEPAAWPYRLDVIQDSGRWAEIVRTTYPDSSHPIYAYTWNRTLRLWPTPSESDALSLLAYILPSVDLTIDGDPEITKEWDESLMLGALSKFTGDETAYEKEATKIVEGYVSEDVAGDNAIETLIMDGTWNDPYIGGVWIIELSV